MSARISRKKGCVISSFDDHPDAQDGNHSVLAGNGFEKSKKGSLALASERRAA
jgi:hypothetical protein